MLNRLDQTWSFTKTVRTHIQYPPSLLEINTPESIAVFDIETTGLSGVSDQLTVGGLAWLGDHAIHLEQFFVPAPENEAEVLGAFLNRLGDFTCLCHYNGDRFDIPFLCQRARHHTLQHRLFKVNSCDWLTRVRNAKSLLGLPDCRLQTVQHYFGVERADHTTGKQAVEAYYDWLNTGSLTYRNQLLYHNADDIVLMFDIMAELERRVAGAFEGVVGQQ